MDPVTGGLMVAGGTAAGNALAAWMQSQAQRDMAARQREYDGNVRAAEAAQMASKGLTDSSNQNLGQLMSAYRSILG